ncbi:MAG: hypothetical protein EOP19_10770, partial [Hyphomicrobiales bacterium]
MVRPAVALPRANGCFSYASAHYKVADYGPLRAFGRTCVAETTLIGIDVGTTAIKAVLIDARGNRLDSFSRPYPIARPAEGHAEQDPGDWMEGVLAALGQFEADHDLSGLAGIGICSQVNTHVFVDAGGAPLIPAIIWQDGRSAPARPAGGAGRAARPKTAR